MFSTDSETFDNLKNLWGIARGQTTKPVAIWIGAGASSWLGYERWSDLATNFHRHYLKAYSDYPRQDANIAIAAEQYPQVFQFCKDADSQTYNSMLANAFAYRPPTPVHQRLIGAISPMEGCCVVTTNVDEALEQSLKGFELLQRSDLERASELLTNRKLFLAKLHGSISSINSTVFTTSDYEFIRSDSTYLSSVRHILATCVVIFLGYSVRDSYLIKLLEENDSEHSLFGSGPHFLIAPSERPELPKSVKVVRYNNDFHTDHRSSLLAVELLSRPTQESRRYEVTSNEATAHRSAHFLSDFFPVGAWRTGETIPIKRSDGSDTHHMIIGSNWSEGELNTDVYTPAYDLAVGLICFDHVVAPVETVPRLYHFLGYDLFLRLVKEGVFQFVHWEGYDSVMCAENSAVGFLATANVANLKNPMDLLSRQMQAAPGGESKYSLLMSSVEEQIHRVELSGSGRNFADVCNGLFISPLTRSLLGMSDATPAGSIPRWIAFPALRVLQIARVGASCQLLGFASMKLMAAGAPFAEAAFSAISMGVFAKEAASYVLARTFNTIPEGSFQPNVWESITRFRNVNDGVVLRSNVMKYLESNAGAEIAAALDGGLRSTIPSNVLERSAQAMSALLTAESALFPTNAIWSDASRLQDGPALWRKGSRARLTAYLREKQLGPYDLCPCGSHDKVKHCCHAALAN